MDKSKAVWWIIGLVVVAAVAYCFIIQRPKKGTPNAPAVPSVVTGEAITIGAVLSLTPDCGSYGAPLRRSIQMATDEINSARGVLGRPLRVQFEDGKCDSAEGTAAAKKLFDSYQIKYIIGDVNPGGTPNLGTVADENKVIVISPMVSPPEVSKDGEYLFSFAPSAAREGATAAEYAVKELGAKKAAIVSEQTDYAQARRDAFKASFKAQGGKVVADDVYQADGTDFQGLALKIKNSKADVIYIAPQSPEAGLLIVKQLKEDGVGAALLTGEAMIRPEIVAANAADLEGIIGLEAFFDEGSEWAKTFLDAYQTKFNEVPPFPMFMANAYSITYLIKDLIEQNQMDTEKAQKSLSTLTGWAGGALADVDLDAEGNIVWKNYSVKQVVQGVLKDVKVFTAK